MSQWAGKYLMEHGYAAKDKVAISGGSNGGLLVAACVNQAPGLWGAAIAERVVSRHDSTMCKLTRAVLAASEC